MDRLPSWSSRGAIDPAFDILRVFQRWGGVGRGRWRHHNSLCSYCARRRRHHAWTLLLLLLLLLLFEHTVIRVELRSSRPERTTKNWPARIKRRRFGSGWRSCVRLSLHHPRSVMNLMKWNPLRRSKPHRTLRAEKRVVAMREDMRDGRWQRDRELRESQEKTPRINNVYSNFELRTYHSHSKWGSHLPLVHHLSLHTSHTLLLTLRRALLTEHVHVVRRRDVAPIHCHLLLNLAAWRSHARPHHHYLRAHAIWRWLL